MPKITFHVTDLDSLVWFKRIEDMTTAELVARLRRESAPNDKMLIGTAFHKMLENPPDELNEVTQDGFTFRIDCDAEIILPQVREIRATKEYHIGGLDVTLTGGCDGITGTKVYDHKLTFRPEPENYFQSYQWRAYLDIYNADSFTYYLYHAIEDGDKISIKEVSQLDMYRYPGMVEDLEDGILEMVEFAREHLPEKIEQ